MTKRNLAMWLLAVPAAIALLAGPAAQAEIKERQLKFAFVDNADNSQTFHASVQGVDLHVVSSLGGTIDMTPISAPAALDVTQLQRTLSGQDAILETSA